ncbi:MAG: PAS domain S-box protein [Bacteroidia bacterium]|nr:PAS domain S-box protein [Bacteroidia bacterium]
MINKNLFKILFIEDLPSDVDLAVLELRKEKLKFEHITICTREDLLKALKEFKPDLIISDYMMPTYNGLQALRDVKEFDESIPFILYTGSINEETAVECIKAGAEDYIIKEHLTRLPFAVKEAFEQKRIRAENRVSELLLKENEEKLQSIFSATPAGMGLIINRRYFEVNDTFCRMTGYSRSEIIGKSSAMMYPTKEEFEIVGVEKYGQIAKKGIGSVETRLKCKDGKIINIISTSTPLDPGDLSKGVTFSIMDITDSKQTETALRESEERFRSLYNDAVVGLYRTNSQGEILLINRAMLKMLGFQSFEELVARNIKEADYGPSYERQQFIDQLEKAGEVKDLEAIWICRDGKEIFVRESAKAIYDSDGKILYYDGTVEDITERKQAAEALHKIQHLFETLALVSPVGIFRTDSDGNTTYVNPRYTELTGLSPEEAMGKGWLNAVHPDDKEKLKESWLSDFKSQKVSSSEYRFQRSDGSIIWVMGNAVPELTGNEIAGYIGTITDITERKKAEEALVENETKYRQLVTRSPDGIFIVDLSGKFLSVNKAICDNLKCSEEELLSMNIWDIVPEQYHSLHKQRLMAIIKGESTNTEAEYGVIGKDGIEHFVEVLSVPYHKGKEIIGFQGIARDITERKKMNDILISSEERLKILFDYAPDAYYLNDLKGNFIDGNIAAEKLLGYNRNELIGKNFLKLKLLSLGQLPKATKQLIKNSLGQASGPDEFVLNRRDGSKVTVEIITHPVKIKDHTLVLGIARDVTERKRVKEALRVSEERYRELFLNNPVPTYIFDTETLAFIEVNDATVESYGYSREEFASMTLKDIRVPEDIPDLLVSVKELGLETFHSTTMRHRRKDGTVFPVEITSHSLPEKNNRKMRLVMTTDITERLKAAEQMKLAKEKAEASDRLKTIFLNNISHEVRTPLNGILGFSEIISQPDLSEEVKKDSLAMLHESSNRLLSTITNYMDISLITSGSMSVHKKELIPGQVLRKIFDNYETICSNRKLELLLKIPEQTEKISINSDPEIFQKIISHLLSNAIKFTEKGSIEYGYKIHEGEIEFFVKDTGIGIGKESIDNIFDHFVKEDRGPSRVSEGSGLGLSIVKGMIEIIGASIRVESEMGVGSCFSFTIPLLKEKEIALTGTPGRENKKIISGASILVAEDDETNFFYLKALLTHETGATILHASNGREAIELFKANPDIILILMDIKMPEIDGFEATKQIKLLKKEVPVIAITAYAMSGDEERVLAAGCDSYLSKPISKKSLLEKMAEFIKV